MKHYKNCSKKHLKLLKSVADSTGIFINYLRVEKKGNLISVYESLEHEYRMIARYEDRSMTFDERAFARVICNDVRASGYVNF